MSDKSKIEWTNATWNPITGCAVVSAGCKNCYAMKLAGTRLQHHPSRAGLTIETSNGPVWSGEVRFNEEWLYQPLRWKTPRMIFVCAHGDLFPESVPDEWIDQVFAVMALAPQHTFQVLTKRPERMRAYLQPGRANPVGLEALALTLEAHSRHARSEVGSGVELAGDIPHLKVWPLPNVWLGVSVENQHFADTRIPLLLQTPAAVRWISAEPLLGLVDLEPYIKPVSKWSNAWLNNYPISYPCHKLDWVVSGGESGPEARPMHPDWGRSLRDQCQAADVPFFFKQWGEFSDFEHIGELWNSLPTSTQKNQVFINGKAMIRVGKKAAGRMLDGRTWDEYPEARS